MLQTEPLVAKIGFDTTETGPLKVCQKLANSEEQVRINIGEVLRRRRPPPDERARGRPLGDAGHTRQASGGERLLCRGERPLAAERSCGR